MYNSSLLMMVDGLGSQEDRGGEGGTVAQPLQQQQPSWPERGDEATSSAASPLRSQQATQAAQQMQAGGSPAGGALLVLFLPAAAAGPPRPAPTSGQQAGPASGSGGQLSSTHGPLFSGKLKSSGDVYPVPSATAQQMRGGGGSAPVPLVVDVLLDGRPVLRGAAVTLRSFGNGRKRGAGRQMVKHWLCQLVQQLPSRAWRVVRYEAPASARGGRGWCGWRMPGV
jgi:hypothetical protein